MNAAQKEKQDGFPFSFKDIFFPARYTYLVSSELVFTDAIPLMQKIQKLAEEKKRTEMNSFLLMD